MNSKNVIFRQLFDSESSTYTYLLGCKQTGQAALIDPVKPHAEMYLTLIGQLGLTLTYALDTHTHADHITALGDLRERTGCVTVMGQESAAACANRFMQDGDVFTVGAISLKALHTPGHTDDSYSFYLSGGSQNSAALFTGDTLLIRGTGRTDFQNGDARAQYNSLFNGLLQYPGDTLVYPGHDYKGWTVSTVDEERQFNPRLQIKTVEEYIALMGSLNLPNPKMMDVAVPANRACGNV